MIDRYIGSDYIVVYNVISCCLNYMYLRKVMFLNDEQNDLGLYLMVNSCQNKKTCFNVFRIEFMLIFDWEYGNNSFRLYFSVLIAFKALF